MKVSIGKEFLEIETKRLPPIFVEPTTPLLPLFFTFSFFFQLRLSGFLTGLFIVAGCMTSIFLHEVGHILAAKRYGMRPLRITLSALGGLAEYEGPERGRWVDRKIIFAGPAVNIVLATGLFILMLVAEAMFSAMSAPFGDPSVFYNPPPVAPYVVVTVLRWLAWFNLALAAINLLPAFPLDGGELPRVSSKHVSGAAGQISGSH